MSDKRNPLITKLIILVVVGLVFGVAVYRALSSTQIQRMILMSKPRPLPHSIVSVFPVPGEQIPASQFNSLMKIHRTYGYVCFKIYDDELRELIGGDYSIKDLQLLLNGRITLGYWEGNSKAISIFSTTSEGPEGELRIICWDVILPPGDYLAELSIHGVSDTVKYKWAFRITDE